MILDLINEILLNSRIVKLSLIIIGYIFTSSSLIVAFIKLAFLLSTIPSLISLAPSSLIPLLAKTSCSNDLFTFTASARSLAAGIESPNALKSNIYIYIYTYFECLN